MQGPLLPGQGLGGRTWMASRLQKERRCHLQRQQSRSQTHRWTEAGRQSLSKLESRPRWPGDMAEPCLKPGLGFLIWILPQPAHSGPLQVGGQRLVTASLLPAVLLMGGNNSLGTLYRLGAGDEDLDHSPE